MANVDDHLIYYREFFENFAKTVNPQDQLPVKLGSYKLINLEVIGAVIDWTTQYLTQKQCPQSLLAPLIQIVIEETRKICKKHPIQCGFNPTSNAYEPLKLMQTVMAKTNEICLRYLDNSMLCSLPPPGPPYNTISVCASKNKRRRMEDRHVVIHDLNTMFNVKEASPSSYYAIFDGHAGHDAAAYSAAHLHQFLAESKHFITNPEQALLDAFCKTDALFIEKCKVENFTSGTTAVCALLRPKENTLYIAWVGDSQALLVNQGRILQCVKPHKPCREDEKNRIESQGGFVSFWGTWRVNGQLAVSRAIGDYVYKPYITAIPEIREIQLDGGEDFLILGCDGLWDFLSEDDTALAVYNMVCQNPDQTDIISEQLVKLSKESGSLDNISVIVVFLREPSKIAAEAHWANRNGSPPIAMDTSLDNSNNPFANSNGSENTMSTTTETTPALATTIDPDTLKTDGFLLNLSTENYKQNGGDVDDLISSPTDDFYRKLDKSNGKRSASEFDEDDDDDDDLNDNDNVIDNDNERDEDDNDVGVVDDDLGPETDVDTADVLSPSILTAKALADGIINNNPEGSFNPFIEKEEVEKAALEIDRIVDDELQKQQISDDDDEIVERKISTSPSPPTTVAPPLISDEVPVNPANVPVHDVAGLEDNVADSGDDSEDEWNYIKGDEANKENLNPAQPEQEVAASFEEDIDNMSQLNPNAAEFVPVSPTRSIPSPACQSLINDPVISQSPKRASDIDLNVPNPQEFENEVKSRPSDVEACDNNTNDHEEINDHRTTTQELENLLNGKNIDEIPEFQPGTGLTPTKISHDEFHFGPNAAPFTPGKFLDQSEAGLSTRAVFGDESTATIASFDESAFGQDHIDLSSILNKEQDPMSMSFYQDKNESDIIDLNRVQPLPDDLDEFLSKADEPVVTNTEKSDDIINLDNDERVQTTDLDKIIDDEKEIASPVDDLSDDFCELPKSPDLITNDIIEKENEEEKEKEEIKEKEQINEKEEEETKEAEIKETVCDMISKSPELVALSPSPEPTQVDLLENQNTLSETDQLIEEKIDEVKEQQQEQLHQDQPSLDDLIEHKLVTPEPEIEAVQEKLNMEVISPLPTHELLTSSPEIPIEALLETKQSEFPQTQETIFESDQCIHEEDQLIDTSEISTNVEKKEEELIIASPVEDVTSSVKDTISPVVMSPIPDQDTVPVSEQEISPVGESSPILQQQSEVLVPEVCPFSPPESVATVEVDSFLERSDISDAHSPLEASPVATQPIESVQLDVLDADHLLSKCVYPLPTENEIPIKTEEIVEIEDNKAVDTANEIEDNKAVEDIANKIVEDTAIPAPAAVATVEEVVEQKAEQIDDKLASEVSTTTTVATAAAAAVGVIAAAATAVTAATVVEKKTTDKAKIAAKKSPTAAIKTASSKTTAAASKSKPPTTTKSPSRPSTKLTSNGVSQKPLSSPKTTAAASKLALKPKTGPLTTTIKSTAIDKKPIANGDVKSTKSTTLVKKTEATKTTAKPLSSARPTSSTLNKISPVKSRPTTAPTKVSSSTTNKVSSITSTTTSASASAKPRPATISQKPATTTKTSPTSTTSKTNVTKTTSSTKTLSSPRAPRPPTTTTLTAKPRVPLTKTITKTSADTEKQNKESANKLTASRSTTTTTTRTAGKTVSTTTLKKTEIKNSGTRTTATKTTTTITGKKPTEIARNIKATTTKTTKIEKPIQNGISSVVTEQIIVNNDNEPQLVKDNSPIDNKLIVEATTTD